MDDSNTAAEQESAEPAMDDGTKIIFTRHSISEGSFASGFWRAHNDKEWTAKIDNTNDNKTEDDVSGVSLTENIRMILPPSSRNSRSRRSRNNRNSSNSNNNDTACFHGDLKTDDLDGMVVLFDAKANHSISVVLSPWPGIEATSSSDENKADGSALVVDVDVDADAEKAPPSAASASAYRYEVVLGAGNNTTTKIRKLLCGNVGNSNSKKSKKSSFVTIPSRVCRGFGDESDDAIVDDDDDDNNDDNCWTSYWVCLSGSRLYVGMGKVPGKECFGVLEEKEEEDEEDEQQAQNESKDDDPAEAKPSTEDGQEEGKRIEVLPIRYVGIGNDAVFQKNRESMVALKNLVVTNVPPCLDSLLKTIQSQDDLPIVCLAPAAKSSSGMDIDQDAETLELKKYMEDYKAECLVRKKRAKKYGTNYREQPMKDFLPWTMAKRLQGTHNLDSAAAAAATKQSYSNGGFVAGDIDFLDPKEISKREARLSRFAAKPNSDGDTKPPTEETLGETATKAAPRTDELSIEKAWDKENMLRPIRRDPPAYLWKESPSNADTMNTTKGPDPFSMYDKTTKAATWIPDKLHVSSIDWAAFKQIRNDDLIHHLEAYGPIKYIEWLGDVSCNICFANKACASRALVCLSNELPSPPPLPNITAAEPVTTETETALLETKVEEPLTEGNTTTTTTTPTPMIDLGCMTWRFGTRPIRKISNDRHGKKGTTARYLLRAATTEDVLIERPSSWPEPPGGFSADLVLGPNSDYASAKNKAKTKHKKQQQQQQTAKKSNSQQQEPQNRRGSNSKRKRGRGEPNANKNGKNERKKTNGNNNNNNSNSNSKPASNPVDLLSRGLSSSRGGFSVEEMEKERQAKKRQKAC